MKKFILFSGLVLALSVAASPALAETSTTTPAQVATKIACVGTAVAAREASIGTAYTARATAIASAYSTRATALAAAYANTTTDKVRIGTKAAWSSFNKVVKLANTNWRTSRVAAWATFRKAAEACKAPVGVSDSANSTSEADSQ